MQRPGSPRLHIISSEDLPSFWTADRLPTPQKQLDDLILWLGANQASTIDPAQISAPALAAYLGLKVRDKGDGGGLGWLFKQLDEKKLYLRGETAGKISLQLNLDGWQRYEELKKTNIQSRTAFMAMKFGDETLTRVVTECFRPAVARAGFELRLLTDEQPAGLIDDQLRAAILGSRFLIQT